MKTKIIIISIMAVLASGILLPLRFLSATEQLTPIIIVPGVGGSLNWQVMTDKGPNTWDFPPSVNEYKHLIQTLEARGYVLNQNLFIAHYDWRQSNILSATQYFKPVIDTATQINNTQRVYVIAHSMGGLVTRSYLENNNDYRVSRVIFLGTPNNGSSDAYTLWENGELPTNYPIGRKALINSYLWYLSAVVKFWDNKFDSVQHHILSTRELMPVYDYLKDVEGGEVIAYGTHKLNENTLSRNAFLENLNHYSKLQKMIDRVFETHIIAGTGEETLKYIPVAPDNDPSNPQWTDGVPLPNPPAKDTPLGDGTVLLESALIKNLDIHKRIFLAQSVWGKIVSIFRPHPTLSYIRRGNDDDTPHPNPLLVKERGNDDKSPLLFKEGVGGGSSFIRRGVDVVYADNDDEYTHEEYIQNCINQGNLREFCEQKLENYFLSTSYPIKLHTIPASHGELPTAAIPKIFEILSLGTVPETESSPSPIRRLLQLWIGSPVSVDITGPDGISMNEIENIETATSGGDNPIQIISIPEPEQGTYTITLTGIGTGEYHVGASLISDTEQSLETVSGTTSASVQTVYTLIIPEQPEDPTQNQTLFEQEPTTDYMLSLSKGWNLISIPSQTPNPEPQSFFGEHTQNIESIWAYDATQETPWLVYRPNQEALNSLITLSPGYGYWVKWTSDTPITITKEITPLEQGPQTPPSRTLVNGWNLIGTYHLSDTRSGTLSTAFQTLSLNNTPLWKSILGYNNATKIFERFVGTDFETAGNGYWLFVSNKNGASVFAP